MAYRTAQIKPSTRDAIKDQLALAAERIIVLKTYCGWLEGEWDKETRLTLWQRIKRWL